MCSYRKRKLIDRWLSYEIHVVLFGMSNVGYPMSTPLGFYGRLKIRPKSSLSDGRKTSARCAAPERKFRKRDIAKKRNSLWVGKKWIVMKWNAWNEWIDMNQVTWMTWNEGIETHELKRMNCHEWIEMNELKWRNWSELKKVNWHEWIETNESKGMNLNERVKMKAMKWELKWRNGNDGIDMKELTWMNWKE